MAAMTGNVPYARAAAALQAALLGDALGVPYEFNRPEDLPPLADIDMKPPLGFDRSHRGTPVGTWSDDGALLLALMDSLHSRSPFDVADFAQRMLAWYREGAYTPDGRVFDIGLQTRAALEAIEAGTPVLQASTPSVSANGNGSLMRVLPVAFMPWPKVELVRVARLQSMPTHAHLRSQLCCALYVLMVHGLLSGQGKQHALAGALEFLPTTLASDDENEFELILKARDQATGSGYVVDSLWSAWSAFSRTSDIDGCLRSAVAFGHDTDTTACIAGGLAGAFYGAAALPSAWMARLQGRALVDRLMLRLD